MEEDENLEQNLDKSLFNSVIYEPLTHNGCVYGTLLTQKII